MIGQKLGHYHVLAKIGAGGMGVVYLAEDTRLGRKVALKLLPPEFAADAERLARFEREARAAAALNHPYIAAVYDVGAAGETQFIVQEYVQGQTLRALLAQAPLPLKRLLDFSIEMAEALAAAHSAGVVHRDVKPENVFVTAEGHVKLLDFGLAKLVEGPRLPAGSDPTRTESRAPLRTTEGQLLGTVGYMAPEQVEGQAVDHRADLFALGCVLYEMASGQPPFSGRSALDTLHRIVHAQPGPVRDVSLPDEFQRIVEKALAKDPADRYQHADDLVVDVRRLRRDVDSGRVLRAGSSAAQLAPQPVARLVLLLPQAGPLALGSRTALAISPDGTQLVYVAQHGSSTQLSARRMDEIEPVFLVGTEGGTGPFFSPDGHWLGFFAHGKLKKVRLKGRPPVVLCDALESRGACWLPDDTILFTPAQATGLWSVPATGGTPQPVTAPDLEHGEVTHRWPEFLPGGKAALFTIGFAGRASYDEAHIAVRLLQTGEQRTLIEGGSHAHYLPTGHLVFARAGALLAAPFDLARLELNGPAVPILEGIFTETTGVAQWTCSSNGSLVYVAGGPQEIQRSLLWVNRKGAGRPLPVPGRTYEEPRLSPDGKRLAVGIRGAHNDIWVYDIRRGTLSRLTFEGDNFAPIWTRDGRRVLFSSNRLGPSNIFWAPADGSGPAERLLESEHDQVASCCSPNGQLLAFTEYHPDSGADIGLLPLKGERRPRWFRRTPFNEWQAIFSPDGRWIAYTSDESGRPEVYVESFLGPGGRWQISTDGGTGPLWAQSGHEIFYGNADKFMAVRITAARALRVSSPRVLFTTDYTPGSAAYLPGYDGARSGKEFVMIKETCTEATATQLQVVLGWFGDLARRPHPAG